MRLALQVLSERDPNLNEQIDLLTYHEGSNVELPKVRILRIPVPSWINGVGPGVSIKKLLCDVIFTFSALKLVFVQREQPYSLVHAVEESVFVAWLIKLLTGIPYIYDMDSSLSLQLTEKWFLLRPLRPIFSFFESLAIKGSLAVVPVCDALAALADKQGSPRTSILRDVSLLKSSQAESSVNLRNEIHVPASALLILYIGNLESYQGIELLLQSYSATVRDDSSSYLVFIGGIEAHIQHYRKRALQLGLDGRVFFLGPRPLAELDKYIYEADILASPRVRGNNTPMKIYSYLHSGKAIIATDLPTHTQVLDNSVAALAAPEPDCMRAALLELIRDKSRRLALGTNARSLAEKKYTFEVFRKALNAIYDAVEPKITMASKVKPTPIS